MRTSRWMCVLLLFASLANAEDEAPVITGFKDGKVKWQSKTNEMYRIEWAWKLDGSNTVWSTNWAAPEEVGGTGVVTEAAVPMFYRVVKMATHKALGSPEAWSAYDAAGTDGLTTKGYLGALFDGRYVYFVPAYNDVDAHGEVLRYDTSGAFTNDSSWAAYDAGNTGGLSTKGYEGGMFDGRYIYFSPRVDAGQFHGRVLRYDTSTPFQNGNSWQAYDAGATDGLTCAGYIGGAFDGRFIYFAPRRYAAGTYHGNVLRFDSRWPHKIPEETSGGSSY